MATKNMHQEIETHNFLLEENDSYLSNEELNYFRQLILLNLASAKNEIERLRGSLLKDNMEKEDHASAYSWHMADAGTDAMEQEKMYLMIDRQQKLINYLSRALERIKNKTYGICRVTGRPISKERLEAIPHTDLSLEAKLNGYD